MAGPTTSETVRLLSMWEYALTRPSTGTIAAIVAVYPMLKNTDVALATATQTKITGTESTPSHQASGIAATTAQRITSHQISVWRSVHRSTSTPAMRLSNGIARYCAMPTRPTWKAEACRSRIIIVGTTNKLILSPTLLTLW